MAGRQSNLAIVTMEWVDSFVKLSLITISCRCSLNGWAYNPILTILTASFRKFVNLNTT